MIRYWIPEKPKQIQYCKTARFFEYLTILPDGTLSPDSSIAHKEPSPKQLPTTIINTTDHPLCGSDPITLTIKLPPKDTIMGLTIKDCAYRNTPCIQANSYISTFQLQVPQ